MKKIFFATVILSFLILIGGSAVLANDNGLPPSGITPDSPFYFLKNWKETIQLFLTFGAENKAKQYLHLADVRLAEYQRMLDKGKTEIAQRTLDKYEKQLNHAIEITEELKNKGKDIKTLSQRLETTASKHVGVLESNLQKAPEAAKKGISRALEVSKRVIKTKEPTGKEQGCVSSGGTVRIAMCCLQTQDFPNNCLIGACGCGPQNSHEVKICDCGEGSCFDGSVCAKTGQPEDISCIAQSGKILLLSEAKRIAIESECGDRLKETYQCNQYTGTWWIDLDIKKTGCSPACVINVETKQAEINWRCAGLLPSYGK